MSLTAKLRHPAEALSIGSAASSLQQQCNGTANQSASISCAPSNQASMHQEKSRGKQPLAARHTARGKSRYSNKEHSCRTLHNCISMPSEQAPPEAADQTPHSRSRCCCVGLMLDQAATHQETRQPRLSNQKSSAPSYHTHVLLLLRALSGRDEWNGQSVRPFRMVPCVHGPVRQPIRSAATNTANRDAW